MIKLGIPNESSDHETRVTLTPDANRRLERLGVEVSLQSGAGQRSGFGDDDYRQSGVRIEADAAAIWSCDVVATINPPKMDSIRSMKPGAVLVTMLRPLQNPELVRACAESGVTAMSYDFVPRISRAQAVDVLSAMSNIGGYKAILIAANLARKMFPMMMTAAGTATPARVFIIGAGVAGLQAIATAKRLGAIVEAYDVRPAVKEQVESLGARFVEFQLESKEGAGGYAASQTEEEQRRQREQMQKAIADADVVVTTALIPGRPAPKLIDDEMVRAMRPGSVIVDLAAETGGNCTLTQPGRTIEREGVTISGELNLPATLPFHASQMLSRILTTLLSWMIKDGAVTLNFDDEVFAAMTITHGGDVRAPRVREAMGLPPREEGNQIADGSIGDASATTAAQRQGANAT